MARPQNQDLTARLFQRIRSNLSAETQCAGDYLSPYFADDSSRQIPIWWDYANKGEIECVNLQVDDWYYVFGYAKENNILYMLIENHYQAS